MLRANPVDWPICYTAVMQHDLPQQPAPDSRFPWASSRLLELARTGRLRLPASWLAAAPALLDKGLYPLAALTFAALVPTVAALFGLPLVLASGVNPAAPSSFGFTILLIASFAPFFLLIWLWLRLAEQRPLWTTGMERPWLRPYLRGLLVGLVMFGTAVAILGALGYATLENSLSGLGAWSLGGALLILAGWLVQGSAEELLTRGFLLPVLGIRWGTAVAVFISSLLFSALHLGNPNISGISLLNLTLFGVFAALYALAEGGLWGVYALHAIWNWAQGNLFGFAVSGLEIKSGILIDLHETGPDNLTGGVFGPEGGLVVTGVLLVGILAVGWYARRVRL